MSTILVYLLLFNFSLTVITSEGHKSSHDWQYLVLAQQWPATVCVSQKVHQKCRIPSYVSSWTIHGIWPTGKHSDPSFCNKSMAFSIAAIKPIEDELLVVWPNLFTNTAVDSFWEHEWLKHGTCATSLAELDTEFKYFSAAIKIHNLYNILNFLNEDDIIPDENKKYHIDQFQTAIEKKTGKKAVFQCKDVEGYSSSLILSVSICITKNFALMDCPGKHNKCKSSIMYLPLTSTNSYLEDTHFHTTTFIVISIVLLFIVIIIFTLLYKHLKKKQKDKTYSPLLMKNAV